MADMFDYLSWRGDLPFSIVPPTPVDALIFSALVYIDFSGIVGPDAQTPITLKNAAEAFLAQPDPEEKVRVKNDLKLLSAAAASVRFADCRLVWYRNIFIPEEETQFAAISYLLEDGSAFLAFRGTDYTVIGWKEDFNMSFQYSIPAQREALRYTEEFAAAVPMVLHLGGHSKGGNLAVYAAAKAAPEVQQRIGHVYNHDGPGFTESMMGDPGYINMVPRIRTYIPESSIIGMLLEHEEPYTVIKSTLPSVLQHEPYSWAVMGGDFIHMKEISDANRFLNQTIKNWIADMPSEERGEFVQTVFELLDTNGSEQLSDLLHPKKIHTVFKTLSQDEKTRKLLAGEMVEFLRSAFEARDQLR